MPTYEYACAACDTRQEVQQKMTDPSLTVCPACGAPGLRKLFTNVGVVFKGSGFYRNDSRESGKSAASSDSSTPAKASTGSSDSSSSSGSSTSESPSPAAKPSTPAAPAPSSSPATTAS